MHVSLLADCAGQLPVKAGPVREPVGPHPAQPRHVELLAAAQSTVPQQLQLDSLASVQRATSGAAGSSHLAGPRQPL
jgi:hypothetical protein